MSLLHGDICLCATMIYVFTRRRHISSLHNDICLCETGTYGNLNSLIKPLTLALFVIAVVAAVGNDDVILEVNAHDVAGFLDGLCQTVVVGTGTDASRRVVMSQGYDGGVAKYGLLNDEAHVDGGLGNAAM